MSRLRVPVLVALSFLAAPVSQAMSAVTVDGSVDTDYGKALSVQTTQTQLGDNTVSRVDGSDGSELDQAYAFISDGVLYLLITGNMRTAWGGVGPTSYSDDLEIFFDTGSGGQNSLRADNPDVGGQKSLNGMAGLTFDTDFVPDYWLAYRGGGYPISAYSSTVSYAELLLGGGGEGYTVGHGTAGGPGTLTNGTNPSGILVTIDNSNVAGVTGGCAASSGAGVTTGIEWAIPLAALGNPTGCIKVSAFVNPIFNQQVANQVLAPVPPGTCNLGAPSGVNFASIPGDQYFSVCALPTPALKATWGRLKSIYR